MFLRFAREEGETVYLCYWHFSFDRLYSRLVIPRAGHSTLIKIIEARLGPASGWYIAFRWFVDDNDALLYRRQLADATRSSHALYALRDAQRRSRRNVLFKFAKYSSRASPVYKYLLILFRFLKYYFDEKNHILNIYFRQNLRKRWYVGEKRKISLLNLMKLSQKFSVGYLYY